jgi:hypothetical protein
VLLVLLGSWSLLMTVTLTVRDCLGVLLLLLLGEVWVCQMLHG